MQQHAGVYILQNYSTCFGCLWWVRLTPETCRVIFALNKYLHTVVSRWILLTQSLCLQKTMLRLRLVSAANLQKIPTRCLICNGTRAKFSEIPFKTKRKVWPSLRANFHETHEWSTKIHVPRLYQVLSKLGQNYKQRIFSLTLSRTVWFSQNPLLFNDSVETCWRAQLKRDGTRWRTGGEVKGKLANGVGSHYPWYYLGTWCIQHYYRWCAHLGC